MRRMTNPVSAFVMALALGGSAVAATALTAVPAMAQQGPKYSKEFVKVYKPLADIVNAEGADYASVKPQLPALMAAIKNEDDRNAAGNLVLILGNKLNDQSFQRQGLELMLASGKVAPERVGQFNFFVGNLAYAAKDFAAARKALEAAAAAGYSEASPEALIAESYFAENQTQQGLDYLEGAIKKFQAAGKPVPDAWLLRGVKMAYEADLAPAATHWSGLLISSNPSQKTWTQGLQVVGAVNDFDPQAQLDLLRLMLDTGALTTRSEFSMYAETADPRIMSGEVKRVLDAAVAAGVFTTTEDYYKEVKRVVDSRLASQATEAASYSKEARTAAKGNAAQNAGDVYLSMGDWAQAEAMYALAVEKGVPDVNVALTRLGIAQARQGKGAEAKASFAKVTGARAPIAEMWTTYINTKPAA
ncbi:MAG: hypothetical protein WA842_04215 [Croceibacterium sp.]